jgi:catechol 2,3-dioxygenase
MITGVERVDLRVDDVAKASAFYREIAGLEAGDDGELRAPGGGPVLIKLRDDGVSGRAPQRASGLFHTAIRYPSRADLAAALRRIASKRPEFTGASDHGVSEALYLNDPAGNGVELYWDRPKDVWPKDMFTAPLDLDDLAAAGPEKPTAPEGTDVGHVHLRVSDLTNAGTFWVGDLGFDVMHRYGDQALFIATGGYHNHVGLNTWYSAGQPIEPPDKPGVDRVVFTTDGEARSAKDPDGIQVELVAANGGGPPPTAA